MHQDEQSLVPLQQSAMQRGEGRRQQDTLFFEFLNAFLVDGMRWDDRILVPKRNKALP